MTTPKVINPGEHPAQIIRVEKRTSPLYGDFLELVFEIMDGPFSGSKLNHRLSLWHPQPYIARAAHAQLDTLCHVLDLDPLSDPGRLRNASLLIDVEILTQDEGVPINTVVGLSRYDDPSP